MLRTILNILVITIFSISTANSFEKSIDSCLSIDPLNPLEHTKIDFNSGISMPCGLSYFMLSPRGAAYVNGNFDGNLGVGFRRPFQDKNYILGYHLFFDCSMQKPHFFKQCGFSAEYLTDDLDVRVNYYHPILGRFCKPYVDCNAQRWLETEILYKFPKFSVGLSPIYNLTSDTLSIKPKVIIPFKWAVLETGIHFSEDSNECLSYLNLSIPLYQIGDKPVGRSSCVRNAVIPLVYVPVKEPEKKSLNGM